MKRMLLSTTLLAGLVLSASAAVHPSKAQPSAPASTSQPAMPSVSQPQVVVSPPQVTVQAPSQPESWLGYILAAIFAVFTGGNLVNGWRMGSKPDLRGILDSPEFKIKILNTTEQLLATGVPSRPGIGQFEPIMHRMADVMIDRLEAKLASGAVGQGVSEQIVQQMPLNVLAQTLLNRFDEVRAAAQKGQKP